MLTRPNTLTLKFLAVVLVAAAATANLAHAADTVSLTGQLSGASETPPNPSGATGSVEASLNKASAELSWKVVYSGLSGPAGAGHFHGPAAVGQNAGVALGFKGSVESPITGAATLTPEQMKDLLDGKWYVNLHTKAYPGGEIRAQLKPVN